MKKINNDFFDEVEKEYLSNDIYKVARRALNKNKISSLVRVSEQNEYTRNRFSIDLKTLPVTNQKASGRCWIFAGCNVLREKVAKKFNLDNFELSQNYIAFYDKLEKCNYLMESVISLLDKDKDDRTLNYLLSNGIEDGGQWDLFVNIVNKYGVVPVDAFPETFQSSNTREIDGILNQYVRKFAFEARKKNDIEEVRIIEEGYMKNIYKILSSCFGIPPKKFDFEYVDKNKEYHIEKGIDPQTFLREYVGVDLNDYISIINSPTSDKPFYQPYTVKYLGNVIEGKPVKYLNEEMLRFKSLVISQLSDGEPVWFGSDCSKDSDREEGLWDDVSFDVNTLFQIDYSLSKEGMLDTRNSAMNHAMVITGVNIDENGNPTKWKIQNSWGPDHAYKGYYVATDSWFDKYVYQAVINKKYLSEFEEKDLEKPVVELEPWDPMGTLA